MRRVGRGDMKREKLTDKELRTLCFVYQEMNSIRARDGAPINVCHEYWDRLTEQVDDIVMNQTGKQAWLHPFLYDKKLRSDN